MGQNKEETERRESEDSSQQGGNLQMVIKKWDE